MRLKSEFCSGVCAVRVIKFIINKNIKTNFFIALRFLKFRIVTFYKQIIQKLGYLLSCILEDRFAC